MIETKGTETPSNEGSMDVRGEREVVVTWLLHAPPRFVFEAWTRPELVRQWWAHSALGLELIECQADVRLSGAYRYVLRGPGGELAFSGKYTEITPPSRLSYTHVFEPMASAGELAVTVTFTEDGDNTRLLVHELYPSIQVRGAALAAGAERGRRETMKQLDRLVISLARAHSEAASAPAAS
jgi:uncharacterized protein YndB with AHSA1/START domain